MNKLVKKHVSVKRGGVKWFGMISLLVLLSFLGIKTASAEEPVAVLKGVTDQVMSSLKSNGESYRQNSSELYSMVNKVIIPHADFDEMSRWVVGREAWKEADEETRKSFSEELKKLAVRTYARSLLNYSDQTIEFMPLRQAIEGKSRVQVSSVIRDGGRGDLRLDYRLIRSGDSWKVYDIIIEGVSLIHGYRAQFEEAVQRNGVKGALDQIKNR